MGRGRERGREETESERGKERERRVRKGGSSREYNTVWLEIRNRLNPMFVYTLSY